MKLVLKEQKGGKTYISLLDTTTFEDSVDKLYEDFENNILMPFFKSNQELREKYFNENDEFISPIGYSRTETNFIHNVEIDNDFRLNHGDELREIQNQIIKLQEDIIEEWKKNL